METPLAMSEWLIAGPIFNPEHQSDHSSEDKHPNTSEILKNIDNQERFDPKKITDIATLNEAPKPGGSFEYRNIGVENLDNYQWHTLSFGDLDWNKPEAISDNIHLSLRDPRDPAVIGNPNGLPNFADKHHALAFFLIYIWSPDERTLPLCVRSDDGIRIWLNGAELEKFRFDNDRDIKKDSAETCADICLHRDWNILLAAVAERHVEWGFSARLLKAGGMAFSACGPATCIVSGQVTKKDGGPAIGIRVRAYHRGLEYETQLGCDGVTDEQGRYRVRYGEEELPRLGGGGPSLIIRAFPGNSSVASPIGESSIHLNAPPQFEIDLVIDEIPQTTTEYQRHIEFIAPFLIGQGKKGKDLSLADLKEKHIDYIISLPQANISRNTLELLIRSDQIAKENKLPPEVLFAFFNYHPSSTLSGLLGTSLETVQQLLDSAIQAKVIPKESIDIDQVKDQLNELALKEAFEETEQNRISIGNVVAGVIQNEKMRNDLLLAYIRHTGSMQDFIKSHRNLKEFVDKGNRAQLRTLRFTLELSDLTRFNRLLIDSITKVHKITHLRSLTAFDWEWWLARLKECHLEQPQIEVEARRLAQAVEDRFPTDIIAHRIRSNQTHPLILRKFFTNFLENKSLQNFDIRSDFIQHTIEKKPLFLNEIPKSQHKELIGQLRALQRMRKLTTNFLQTERLRKEGIHASAQISRMGRNAFIRKFADIDGGEPAAASIYDKAKSCTATALALLAEFNSGFNPIEMKVMAGPSRDRKVSIPDLETLFGSFDLCECPDCRSVLSPAAYLTDILHFLDNRSATIPEHSALDVLLKRRPDLAEIELTCKNSNTKLTYIDLVNEVLENAVFPLQTLPLPFELSAQDCEQLDQGTVSAQIAGAFESLKLPLSANPEVKRESVNQWSIREKGWLYRIVRPHQANVTHLSAWPQTDAPESQLAINPEHVNVGAYDFVSSQVYPWNLPIDLWTEQVRTYLTPLGVPRHRLMSTFLKVESPTDKNARAIAAEYLGMTIVDWNIIAGNELTPHREFLEFWGYTRPPTDPEKRALYLQAALEELKNVRRFLDRSGLAYQELVELLHTRYINPFDALDIRPPDNDPSTCDTNKLTIVNIFAINTNISSVPIGDFTHLEPQIDQLWNWDLADRIHRFVRLWRKLGWTMQELDQAICGLTQRHPDKGIIDAISPVSSGLLQAIANGLDADLTGQGLNFLLEMIKPLHKEIKTWFLMRRFPIDATDEIVQEAIITSSIIQKFLVELKGTKDQTFIRLIESLSYLDTQILGKIIKPSVKRPVTMRILANLFARIRQVQTQYAEFTPEIRLTSINLSELFIRLNSLKSIATRLVLPTTPGSDWLEALLKLYTLLIAFKRGKATLRVLTAFYCLLVKTDGLSTSQGSEKNSELWPAKVIKSISTLKMELRQSIFGALPNLIELESFLRIEIDNFEQEKNAKTFAFIISVVKALRNPSNFISEVVVKAIKDDYVAFYNILIKLVDLWVTKALDDSLLLKLADIQRLRDQTGLPVGSIVGWYAPLDTYQYFSEESELLPSLYQRIFQNSMVIKVNPGDEDPFQLDKLSLEIAKRNQFLTDAQVNAALLAGLRINASELDLLINGLAAKVGDARAIMMLPAVNSLRLTIGNLARLCRHVSLARGLKVSVQDLLWTITLSGKSPFPTEGKAATPTETNTTIEFVKLIRTLKASGFKLAELDYLLRNISFGPTPLTPSNEIIERCIDELRKGLMAIVKQTEIVPDPLGEITRNSAKVFLQSELVEEAVRWLLWDESRLKQPLEALANVTYQEPINKAKLPNGKAPEGTAFVSQDPNNDNSNGFLQFKGVMQESQKKNLLKESNGNQNTPEYKSAIEKLFYQPRNYIAENMESFGMPFWAVSVIETDPSKFVWPDGFKHRVAISKIQDDKWIIRFAGAISTKEKEILKKVPDYDKFKGVIESIYNEPRARIVHNLKAFDIPAFFVDALGLIDGDSSKTLQFPDDLQSRIYHDPIERKLWFKGVMTQQEKQRLLDLLKEQGFLPNPDVYERAINNLFEEFDKYPPPPENVFLNDADLPAIFDSSDDADALSTRAENRFRFVLGKIMNHTRLILSRSLVIDKLSGALRIEPSILSELLNSRVKSPDNVNRPAMEVFLDRALVERNSNLKPEEAAFPEQFSTFRLLHKIGLLLTKFEVSQEQLWWLFEIGPKAGWLDPNMLPVSTQKIPIAAPSFEPWKRLVDLFQLRDQIREGAATLNGVFKKGIEAQGAKPGQVSQSLPDEFLRWLGEQTGWRLGDLQFLRSTEILKAATPADLLNEQVLLKIKNCVEFANRLGVSAYQCRSWAKTGYSSDDRLTLEDGRSAKFALKAKYADDQWADIAKPLQDKLREKQREALASFLLKHPEHYNLFAPITGKTPVEPGEWKDLNDLYAYFLIDVEMTPDGMMTSRIKQACSSVQLFVQRCLMNLESKVRVNLEDDDAWGQWQWMKHYRVWEANRKIFIYPENWIEPELRDDKSPFFADFEKELSQEDITDILSESALVHYLDNLKKVTHLKVCCIYREPTTPKAPLKYTLHVIGRTAGLPHEYYYRKRTGSLWNAWERLDLDIKGENILITNINRKLTLFWLDIKEETRSPTSISNIDFNERKNIQEPENSISLDSGKEIPPARKQLHISLLRSEYSSGKWSPKCTFNSSVTLDESYAVVREYITKYTNVENHPDQSQVSQPVELTIDACEQYLIPQTDIWIACDKKNQDEIKIYCPIPWIDREAIIDAENNKQVGKRIVNQNFTVFEITFNFSADPNEPRIAYYPPPGDDTTRFNTVESKPLRRPSDPLSTTTTIKGTCFPLAPLYRNHQILYTENTPALLVGDDYIVRLFDAGPRESANAYSICVDFSNYCDFFWMDAARTFLVSTQGRDYPFPYYFFSFYHPYISLLILELEQNGIAALLDRKMQVDPETLANESPGIKACSPRFERNPLKLTENCYIVNPSRVVTSPEFLPEDTIDFSPGDAYSIYNWELFFHIPFLIADRLSKNQRFEEAMKWYHFIFNPTDTSSIPEAEPQQHYWQTKPFYQAKMEKYQQENIVNILSDIAKGKSWHDAVEAWRNNPFKPHIIARWRYTAYQKAVVMKYIDNLISWGDQLFRYDTIESINEATQLYILAAEILGRRPEIIKPKYRPPALTYTGLISASQSEDKNNPLGDFSDPQILAENLVKDSIFSSSAISSSTPALTCPPILYFGVPKNDKLWSYWDTVSNRLTNIRHGRNIEGISRPLALYEPPIDPALLVRAAAAGIDLDSVLSDVNVPLPHYRFNVIIQKATELCAEVKAFGAALLAALEKRDAEDLSLLRSKQELAVLDAVREVKEKQVSESNETLAGLQQYKEVVQTRVDYYSSRVFMNPFEILHLAITGGSLALQFAQLNSEIAAATMHLIPETKLGVPTTCGVTFGGTNIASAVEAFGRMAGTTAGMLNTTGSMVATLAGYQRRMDDWNHQASLASKELAQVEKQINAATARKEIAEKERENHELQIRNAKDIDELMHSKYTNKELYDWMSGQLSTGYFQSYQLAYDMAKRAEQVYRLELGEEKADFIKFGYWDSLKKGLLSGERLYHDLKRMEVAYLDLNKREYELTKHVSLLQVSPIALIQLRSMGRCSFTLPEALFDMDCPGHYFRRIKSIAATIPCIAGPYASVNCRMQLLKGVIRKSPQINNGNGYKRLMDGEDPRFSDQFGNGQAIITSSGQNDSGLFETNLHDERRLPFEGMGVVDSQWQLDLPAEVRQFDYDTINDVILHVRYTAREGGDILRGEAIKSLNEDIQKGEAAGTTRLFSIRHEFPEAWARFKALKFDGKQRYALELDITENHYPFWAKGRLDSVKKVEMFARSTEETVDVFGAIDNAEPNYLLQHTPTSGVFLFGELQDKKGGILPFNSPISKTVLYFEHQKINDLLLGITWARN